MKIAILEPLGLPKEDLLEKIKAAVSGETEIVAFDDRKEDVESLIERSRGADIVVLSNIKYGKEVMEKLPDLKYICVAFTGYDHIDMAFAKEKGIQVATSSGYANAAVAELVFAFAVDLNRHVIELNESVRKGGTKTGFIGWELEGKTLGIIGLGAIGEKVAKIAQGYDMRVLGYNRSPKELSGVSQVELDDLLKESDVITLHVPATEETKNLINEENIHKMKESAILINLARGPVVNSQDLARALNEGRIAGAAIDVFETEPPMKEDHPLLNAKNVIATPHIGFASTQAFYKRADIVAQNIKTYLEGNPQNLVK